ncbi:hypothetical protein [Roseovarius gaetbuli]|uniref:hypothetical protein n=1 Tax=Roseovarius gaetbuli TaxID=1356575 RepID=UPI0014838EE6|nr:hypothetical protein [Roseovarius gaetbuli]
MMMAKDLLPSCRLTEEPGDGAPVWCRDVAALSAEMPVLRAAMLTRAPDSE